MRFLILMLAAFSTLPGWAGGVNSGGGYVVACKVEEKTTYQLWDLKEAEARAFKVDYVSFSESNEYAFAHAAIERIRRFSPDLADQWQKTVEDFRNGDMKFINNAKIKDIDDTDSLFEKLENDTCELVQAAVQVKNPAPNEYRLFIDEKLWNDFDVKTKAGLLIHEAIYKMAMEQGHTKSKDFRRITALLFNRQLDHMSVEDIAAIFNTSHINGCFIKDMSYRDETGKEISKFKLPLEIKGLTVPTGSKEFSALICQDGKVKNFFEQGELIYIKGNKVHADPTNFCISDNDDQGSYFRFNRQIDGQTIMTFSEELCMSTEDPNRITWAKTSPINTPKFWPAALEFERCEGQVFRNGQLVHCNKTDAFIQTKDEQVFVMDSMFYNMSENREFYSLTANSQFYNLEGNKIKIALRLGIDENLNIILEVNKAVKVKINETACTIYPLNDIVLDQWGAFQKIVPTQKHSSFPPDACVNLLNKN